MTALYRKKIHCPNCGFEGNAKIKGSGLGWLVFLCFLVIGIFIWPLLIVAVMLFVYLLFKSSAQVCPKCKYKNPIPLKHYQKTQAV